jgi:SAM-dependent methyltransferase
VHPELVTRITARYPVASAWDRFHVRQRLRLGGYEQLLPFFPASGSVLDIGCGFGLLGGFLAEARPGLAYYGSDVDAQKIALAREALAKQTQATVYAGDVRTWRERPARVSVVAILDVLYLLPLPLQKELFDLALSLLHPHSESSVLLLKILPLLRGPARFRTWLQESLMVRLLRKTQSSGALFPSQDPSLYAQWGRAHGMACQRIALAVSPPSTLLVLRPSGAPLKDA